MKNIIKGVNLIFFNPSFKVYGVDTLRLWVAAHASQSSSILIGDWILGQTKQDLDRLRNALKFLLGNILRITRGEISGKKKQAKVRRERFQICIRMKSSDIKY